VWFIQLQRKSTTNKRNRKIEFRKYPIEQVHIFGQNSRTEQTKLCKLRSQDDNSQQQKIPKKMENKKERNNLLVCFITNSKSL
jgi:hypothetical protein